jgi:hypothetical protein
MRPRTDINVGGYEISDAGLLKTTLSKIAMLLGKDRLKLSVPAGAYA